MSLSVLHNKLPLSTKTALGLDYASFRQNAQDRLLQKDTQLSHFLRFLPVPRERPENKRPFVGRRVEAELGLKGAR